MVRGITHANRRQYQADLAVRWMLTTFIQSQLVSHLERRGDWVVFDEGLCNRTVTVFAIGLSESDESDIESYLDDIPAPDLLVHVDVSSEVAAIRLASRGRPERLMGSSEDEVARFLVDATQCVKRVTDVMRLRGTQVMTVDGTAPLDVVVRGLERAIAGR
jgi:thymidylate kinase